MTKRRMFLRAAALFPAGAAAGCATSGPLVAGQAGAGLSPLADDGNLNSTMAPKEKEFQNYRIGGQTDEKVLGDSNPRNFADTKRLIAASLLNSAPADDPIHEWYRTFSMSFDERAVQIILAAGKGVYAPAGGTQLRYDPELFENSLGSASALLDRCLRYRNQLGGFEGAGVNVAMSYLAFLKTVPGQRNIIENSNGSDLDAIQQDAQGRAAKRFSEIGAEHLPETGGLYWQSKGAEATSLLAGEKADLLTHLVKQQFHVGVETQLASYTRYLTPGTSANYAERYLRLLSLLTEDLTDVFRRLYSASIGLNAVLQMAQLELANGSMMDVPIPLFFREPDPIAAIQAWVDKLVPTQAATAARKPDIIDALVLWTRAVLRELDRRAQIETEFSVDIPLNRPWRGTGALSARTSIIASADLAKALDPVEGTGQVAFTLYKGDIPLIDGMTAVRVTGIGRSFAFKLTYGDPIQYTQDFPSSGSGGAASNGQVSAAEQYQAIKLARLSAVVTTPAQTIPGVASYTRPPVRLGNVRAQGGAGGDADAPVVPDPACRNLMPFAPDGTSSPVWSIKIDRNAVLWYGTDVDVAQNDQDGQLIENKRVDAFMFVTGFVLHLRLRAMRTL